MVSGRPRRRSKPSQVIWVCTPCGAKQALHDVGYTYRKAQVAVVGLAPAPVGQLCKKPHGLKPHSTFHASSSPITWMYLFFFWCVAIVSFIVVGIPFFFLINLIRGKRGWLFGTAGKEAFRSSPPYWHALRWVRPARQL